MKCSSYIVVGNKKKTNKTRSILSLSFSSRHVECVCLCIGIDFAEVDISA